MSSELIGGILAAALTLLVFSYLLGNNPLYRLAQHLFVGVSLGYVGTVVLTTVLWPRIDQFADAPLVNLPTLVPLVLGLLIIVRLLRPGSGGASLPFLLIAVTAAALALAGTLMGTLVPQTTATMLGLNPARPFELLNNVIIIVGVIVTLHYFSFGVRAGGDRTAAGALVAGAGRWLIIITLGAVLGTLTVSFASALIERVDFVFQVVSNLFGL
jgi:hypothetical protein